MLVCASLVCEVFTIIVYAANWFTFWLGDGVSMYCVVYGITWSLLLTCYWYGTFIHSACKFHRRRTWMDQKTCSLFTPHWTPYTIMKHLPMKRWNSISMRVHFIRSFWTRCYLFFCRWIDQITNAVRIEFFFFVTFNTHVMLFKSNDLWIFFFLV